MALIQLEGLTQGHYECRSLDQTLPIFEDLLATEVVERGDGVAVVKHPNTGWLLVIHEGGPDTPTKPHGNHYGFRVADHNEIPKVWEYINDCKDRYGITGLQEPSASHFAYSVYLDEPGGNTLEIEYYNEKAANHGRIVAAGHWDNPLPADRFPGRGYIPQALSHGTMQTSDKEASNRFYTEVLGLSIMGGGHMSTYIGHADTPWYVVVLPAEERNYLTAINRFTLKVATSNEVAKAHEEMTRSGAEMGLTKLGELENHHGDASFIFADLDYNYWELTSSSNPLD
jgi:catechol 2,3-dioxygenase-like lactoylglutathione lyase family enzyme